MESTTLKIDGISCGGCVSTLTRVLSAIPGVHQAVVSQQPGQAVVDYDAEATSPDEFREAIEEAGYDVVA